MFLSFLAAVVLPVLAVASYLFFVAKDQYASSLGFSVQRENATASLDILGGLTKLAGSNTPDPVILYKYIVSRDMIRAVETQVDLDDAFYRAGDPWFSLPPGSSIEEREDHWRRMVQVFLDSGSGLVEIRVRTYSPETAQAITNAIRFESERLLNQLSEKANEDATRFARAELEEATDRLRTAQAAMTDFRARTQIVDPATDFAGRMGLLNSLLAQQAEALIERDLLRANSNSGGDPRMDQIERRIQVIGERIESERARISSADDGSGAGYAQLVSEYEGLRLEAEIAERSYVAALANLDNALDTAQRNSRYLAIYMPPTLAEKAEYPERAIWTGLIAVMFLLLWTIATLTFYAVRDRR